MALTPPISVQGDHIVVIKEKPKLHIYRYTILLCDTKKYLLKANEDIVK